MKYLKYYLFILIIIITSSCDDYLDIKPKGLLIPEIIKDFDLMLNDGTIVYSVEKAYGLLNDNVTYGGIYGSSRWGSLGVYDQNLYSYVGGQIYTGTENSTWNYAYNRIYIANYIIKHLPGAIEENSEDVTRKKNIIADARTLRAEDYFFLVNYYGKQYNESTANTDLGVPIVTDPNVNTEVPERSSVQEVYDFIINEILASKDDLPELPGNRQRFSKPAAIALLARVYFQMEKYDLALQYAEEVLTDYPDYGLINYNNQSEIPQSSEAWNRRDTYRYSRPIGGSSTISLPLSDDYLALFPGGYPYGDDLRTQHNIARSYSSGVYYYRWIDLGYIDYTGISVQEMVLIAAETKARNNELGDALDYLNALRIMRFRTGTYEALSSTDPLEVLTWVIEERRREMPFLHRLLELKRLDNDSRFAKQIIHEHEDETYTLEIHDEKMILPVPPEVLRFNPDMEEYSRN